jgi:ABC-type Zn uptake system ZnuABC Zn-binding protein ZnuA
MRRIHLVAGLLAAVLVVSLASAFLAKSPAALYDIVQQVAGDAVEVSLILPPGASPHTFEPRPSDVRDVDQSAVVYAFGHGIDDWAATIADSTGTPVALVDTNVILRPFALPDADGEEHGHDDEGDADPHYWLSASNGRTVAANVASDLTGRFPEHADAFAANLTRYARELDALDDELRATLADVTNKNLVTLHDAWGYFAEAYGLRIVGSFEPAPGKEPTPAWLSRLAKTAAAAKVRAVYAEPQLSSQGLEAFAQDHGLAIVSIDPEGSDATDSYIDMLRSNAQVIRDNQ